MSGDLWEGLDRKTKSILMWHELMHINVTFDKEGEPVYKLRQHDVQDFYTIIQQAGIDWIADIKAIAESVYDLEPHETDGYSL